MTQKPQRHKDTRILPYSITDHLCDATRDTLHTTRGSAHGIEEKVPSKCERGKRSSNGVAQSAQDHCQRGRTRCARSISARAPASGSDDRSTSPSGSDRGRTCSTRQQLRLFTMDSVDVDLHPCASKQVWIVIFARREQGWGRVRRRCKSSSWRKVRGGVRGRTAPGRRTVRLRYFASSCAKVATENSTSGSSLGTFSSSQRRSRGRHGSCT